MSFFRNLLKIRHLLEKEVVTLLLYSLGVGGILFLADFSFVFAFQGYLREIGLVPEANVKLPDYYPHSFMACLLIFLFVGCLKVIGIMMKSYFSGVANQAFLRNKRQHFFQFAIYNAQNLNTHDMMSLISDTLARCSSSIVDLANVVITLSTVTLLFLGGLTLAPKEMLLGVLLASVLLFPVRWLSFALDRSGKGLTEEWIKSNKTLMEGMRHHYFVKAHGLEKTIVSRGLQSIKNYENHYRRFFLFTSFRNGLPGVLGICLIGVLTYVSINIFKTEGAILLSFLYLFLRLAQGTSELVSVGGSLQLNLSSVDEVLKWDHKATDFLNSKVLEEAERQEHSGSFDKIKIEAENLSFSYGKEEILKDLSFSMDMGDIFIIKGQSGVGKSTIVSLVLGLNKATSGEVKLNGKAIDSQDLRNYQDELAYVGPEPFLFEGTIRENLLFGNRKYKNITDEKIFEVLDRVNLKNFVSKLSDGLEHKFDEHVEASTGQKQRLSLCRALLRDPKLLILDEATANLDPRTEKEIIESVLPFLKKMTTIVITHKGNFADYGTQTLVMERGFKYQIT